MKVVTIDGLEGNSDCGCSLSGPKKRSRRHGKKRDACPEGRDKLGRCKPKKGSRRR